MLCRLAHSADPSNFRFLQMHLCHLGASLGLQAGFRIRTLGLTQGFRAESVRVSHGTSATIAIERGCTSHGSHLCLEICSTIPRMHGKFCGSITSKRWPKGSGVSVADGTHGYATSSPVDPHPCARNMRKD